MSLLDESTKDVRVLLVEDDDGDAKAVKRAFLKAKLPNPIERVSDGIQALELLRGHNGQQKLESPYIVLVDLNMPRMDGIQLLQEIRNDAELKKSIVFMLTTSKRIDDKIAAYSLNVAGYIYKEKVGADFLQLVDLMDSFWRIVELT